MNSITPPFLISGDTIGIAASARWITPATLEPAIAILESWGLRVKLAEGIYDRQNQFAGSDSKRAAQLQSLIDDENVKAVIFARGGYGSVRIVDLVDFSSLLTRPKWFCGFSDITVFHSRLFRMGIQSVHSTVPLSFADNSQEALMSLKNALFGELHSLEWKLPDITNLSNGTIVNGRLCGGNLSVLYSLQGSPDQIDPADAILFIEDVDEMLYHVDRMMMGLSRSSVLQSPKAILLGTMTSMRDNTPKFGFPSENPYGSDAESIICSMANELGIPVIPACPAGHVSDNRALFFGRQSKIRISNHTASLSFE